MAPKVILEWKEWWLTHILLWMIRVVWLGMGFWKQMWTEAEKTIMGLWDERAVLWIYSEKWQEVLLSLFFFTTDEAHRETANFPQPTLCQTGVKNEEMRPKSHNLWRVNRDATVDMFAVYRVKSPIRSWLAVISPSCSLFPWWAQDTNLCHCTARNWGWSETSHV